MTVEAETFSLNADTPVRQTNVDERQVRELPLLTGGESEGRTPLSFIFLDSNVSSAATDVQTTLQNSESAAVKRRERKF